MVVECPHCSAWTAPSSPTCCHCGREIGLVSPRRQIRQYPPSPTLLSEVWLPALLAGLLVLWLILRG